MMSYLFTKLGRKWKRGCTRAIAHDKWPHHVTTRFRFPCRCWGWRTHTYSTNVIFIILDQRRIQDFPEGCQPFWPKLAEDCIKMKKIGMAESSSQKFYYVDPPLVTRLLSYWTYSWWKSTRFWTFVIPETYSQDFGCLIFFCDSSFAFQFFKNTFEATKT